MEISSRQAEGCLVVAVSQELDTNTAAEFDQFCAASIEDGNHRLVLDLSQLQYISSAGLRAILSIAKRLKGLGGGLAVCGLSGIVQEVFTISGFDSLIPVAATAEDALSVI